jgi:hypothetical protein
VQPLEVEILRSPSCGSADAVVPAVERAAEQAGVEVTLIERVVVTQAEAKALRMPGSPTVRVGGRDVEPGADALEDFGLG